MSYFPTVLPAMLLVFAKTLAWTIALELPLGLAFFCERSWYAALVLVLAQVATNPAVELTCMLVGWTRMDPLLSHTWATLLLAELGAFVVEAQLYRVAGITRHPWLTSGVLNAFSFVAGLVLGRLGVL